MSGTLAVVGLGLIGGSFALGARQAGLFDRIVGIDASAVHGEQALAAGLCDELASAVPPSADAVLVAVPSDAVAQALGALQDHPGLVFDVASVKGGILDGLAARPARYLPAHPIAGSERSGPGAARADLFAEHLVVLTPLADSAAADEALLTGWWQALGARVEHMSPAAHDRLFARTSHLPHLVAFAYMQLIEPEQLAYAAGGFRDFSRIAGADPAMWAPILQLNQRAVLGELAALRAALDQFEAAIGEQNPQALSTLLGAAQQRRQAFEQVRGDADTPASST
jgi:prephenate dehydrogenase